MMHRCLVPLLAVLTLPAAAAAQVDEDLGNVVSDILHVWGSPLRLDADDLPPLGAAVGATLLLSLADEPIDAWLREHQESLAVRLLGPTSGQSLIGKFGYTRNLAIASGALYLSGLVFGSEDLRQAGLGCATSNVATTLPRTLVARLVGRMRPERELGAFDFDPFTFDDWMRRSFPGGHGANIMSCASFWNNRFGMGVAEPVIWGVSGAIVVSRVIDRAHWASDGLFGALWGYAVGKAVADRFAEREVEAASPGPAAVWLVWRVAF